MKIFLAATSLLPAYGGPAYSVSGLAAALADAGVHVGLWSADDSTADAQLAFNGIERLRGTPMEALMSFGVPDLIHDNGIWPRYHHDIATLASVQKIPRVVSPRGMLEPWAMTHKGFKKRVAWTLYQRRDLESAACHHASTAVEGENIERLDLKVPVRVIANGIDVPDIRHRVENVSGNATPAGQRTALFLGRVYPIKGLPMLIDAWARVRPDGWRLIIAGPDEAGHLAEVKSRTASAGLNDIVSFAGPLGEEAKRSALESADLFVLPTFSESFGMAIGEALAHGLPVLTTMGAPWPQLTENGCGWRVPTSVEGLERGLKDATSTPTITLRAMGARGRALVADNYQWPVVARRFVDLYSEVTGATSVP